MTGRIPWEVIAQKQAAREVALRSSQAEDLTAVWTSFLTVSGQGSGIYSAAGDIKTALVDDGMVTAKSREAAAFTAAGSTIQLGSGAASLLVSGANTLSRASGRATATNWMNNLVSGLQAQLAGIVDAHGQPVYGLITPRLPSLGYQYDPDGFNYSNGAKGHLYLKWRDENGQEQTRYYDGAGNRSDGTGDTLVGDFMKRALQAVVPSWEAETVRQHFLQEGSVAAAMPAHGAGMPVEDAQHLTQSFTALTFQAVAAPGSDNAPSIFTRDRCRFTASPRPEGEFRSTLI